MKTNTFLQKTIYMRSAIAGFTFLIIIIFLSNKMYAQTADEGASLGIKLGVNITNYNLKEASLQTSPGFNIGLFSSAAFTKHLSIQPELNLNVQNSHISVNNELSKADFNLLLSYAEFAVSGRVSCGKLFFQAGPFISYLANVMISNSSTAPVTRKNFYDLDLGLMYAGGIQLKRWDFGLRYNQGMYKIGKPNLPENTLNIFSGTKTSSYQLYTGYYF